MREVKGIEKVSMLGAGKGARERGGRRLEVEVNSKRRSPRHDVSNLVLCFHVLWGGHDDDDDVYYSKGRRPREDEEGEESYEKRRQWPGRGG